MMDFDNFFVDQVKYSVQYASLRATLFRTQIFVADKCTAKSAKFTSLAN